MPELTIQQILGSRVEYQEIDEVSDYHTVGIDIRDFKNEEDGGDIKKSLGVSNLSSKYILFQGGQMGLQIFYLFILLILQNQATTKDEDPEQRIFIQESGTSVVTFGNRKGQLERRFTVSIFSDETYENTADVDSI